MSDLLIAFFGPIVWAAHFFSLYLTEALLCSTTEPATSANVRSIGAGLTVMALAALLAFAVWRRRDFHLASAESAGNPAVLSTFTGPLAIVSILALLWTSIPLFLLPACTPGGG